MGHTWHFFRAGGVDQVSLRDAADLRALADLDPKLWVALAMPTRDLDIDPVTLDHLDADKDGRIRVPDILAAVEWIDKIWKDPGKVLTGADAMPLDAIQPGPVRTSTERILRDLEKPDAKAIQLDDVLAAKKAITETTLNGDGVVIAETAGDDAALRRAIEDAIATVGSVPDRSGKPGVDEAKLAAFFEQVDQVAAWEASRPAGDGLDAAADALAAVRAKIEDYFARCRVAAFDPRATAALNAQEADFAAAAARSLRDGDDEIARLPLARIEPGRALPLAGAVNPAWAARLATFAAQAVTPMIGARKELTSDDLAAVAGKLEAFEAWRKGKPDVAAGALAADRIAALRAPEVREGLRTLIASDQALAADYAEVAAVEKMVRFQRDLGRVLRNFVNFSDFYSDKDGAFQTGTLYVDGRSCDLCVPVADAGKHGTLAGLSSAYLAYCDLTRGAEKRSIAAAITNGDADHLVVGRNGVFYDRAGNDWDATITKVLSSPISVREAFWAPYKKLARMIEEQIAKRASDADAAAESRVAATATTIANADKAALPAGPTPAPAPAAPAPPAKKIDVGTVAALGVAIGGIGALVVGVLATFLGLGLWMPIGVLALLLLISGPSMLLAWMKLRQRNLGPILDANGWAINGRARINVAFGAALTDLAKLPRGARRTLDDPYADKRSPWRFYVFLALLLLIAGTWYVGKLDSYLPGPVKSTKVLGKYAPAAKKDPAPPAAPDPAPAPAADPAAAPPAAP